MTAYRLLTTLATATLAVLASDAARADLNEDLEIQIAALIGTHNAALPISFVPDPFFGIPASFVTFGTNLGLKDTRAMFVTPGNWADWPNSADECHYEFDLPQSTASYNNLLGFITLQNVPGQWGELTRTGQVQVVHANTSVNVHARNRYILPEQRQSQGVEFPSGNHRIDWRAETQISDAFDIIIPAALLTYNSIKYGAAVANSGASAARQAASQDAARQVIQNIALETGLITASQLFEGRTSVVHEREQEITIYKRRPPQISTSQPVITLEATDFGGVLYQRVAGDLRATIDASDPCDKPFSIGNDAGPLLGIGTNAITWTVRDSGPLPGGGFNSASLLQQILVEDTQAPIMVPPPSRVIEVPLAQSGLDADQVNLGAARVVDLADPDPVIANDGPLFYPINSRSAITWSATDASGNSSFADQLITIKAEGTNNAPIVIDVGAGTLTSQPVDIVLSGSDPDFLGDRFDPLSFRISQRPANGEFVAPLYPFFIEDYRTSPGGPYGEAFYLSNNRSNWLYDNVCRNGSGPNADRIAVDWVYEPEFVQVDDQGKVYMVDRYWQCSSSSASSFPRISTWDRDGNFIGQIQYQGFNDAFVLDRDGLIYEIQTIGSGSSREIAVNRCATDFVGKANRPEFCQSLGRVNSSNSPVNVQSVAYARVDSQQDLLYVTDKQRVHAFDIRNDPPNPIFLATLNASAFPTPSPSCAGSSSLGYALEVDSSGNLYMVNCANERIEKFSPSGFDEQGQFVPGEYVGWMGRCATSTNNACDEDKQASKGFACTDATCTRTQDAGDQPGQFGTPLYAAIDPNDVLYVAEWDNFRVQRFAPDGTFAGQALSTGSGINQGEQPGFVLGNMGRPRAVSVNSTQFYVVDREEGFVHVFETSPLKDITDDSATVTYVSNFDFHTATDSFQFIASDGLADSNTGTVTIDVARNFRPPIAEAQSVVTPEDQPIDITLLADDPDGIAGIDVNGLDTLSYTIVEPPAHGQLSLFASDNATATFTYTPDADYFGTDRFVFVANDGVDDSAPAEVEIEVVFVDDPPVILDARLPERAGLGFPLAVTGEFSDDGAEDYSTSVVWNSEQTVSEGGVNEDDPDNPFIEGVLLIEPVQGQGVGYGIAQRTFTTPGSKTVRFCVTDQASRGGCVDREIIVEALVNLGLELPDDQGGTAPAQIPAGESFTIDVIIGNLEPDGVAGLIAQAISLQGTIETPGVVFTGASEGNCTISPDGQTIDCDFGDFGVGEQRTITLSFATDPNLLDGVQADIRLSVTTGSEAVNEVTEAYLTRDVLGQRIFRDRFDQP
ncbi:MAG: Ig-like domain-containing protein [Wenzhouxiangella sp.]|nr:Ig-like domain-containing protein [Wenzhouxiangella sp.]